MQPEKDEDANHGQTLEMSPPEGSPEIDAIQRESSLVDYEEVEEIFVGPFPHPEILAQYEDVLEGSAERIMSLTERQFAHRQSRELAADATVQKVIEGDSTRESLGIWLGAFVAVFLIGCGTFLVYNGHDWAGVTMIVSTIVGIVGVFIYGTQRGRDEGLEDTHPSEFLSRRREED